MVKLEKISAWNLTKVKNKKQVIEEAQQWDRIPVFSVHSARKCGGSCAWAMETKCMFWKTEEKRKAAQHRERVAWNGVGRHSLAVRGHTDIHKHLERHDLDMDGAKTGIIVVDTHTKVSDLLFDELFVLVCRFHRDGKGFQSTERDHVQGFEKLVVWQAHSSLKDSPTANQAQAGPQSCVQHSFELQQWFAWEGQMLRFLFHFHMRPDEIWVVHNTRILWSQRISWRKTGLPLSTQKIANWSWTTVTWAVYDGDVPNFAGSSFHVGMENYRYVWKSGLLVYCVGPQQRPKMEVQSWVSQQRRAVGHTNGNEGNDWTKLMTAPKFRKEDVVRSLLELVKPGSGRKTKDPTWLGWESNQGICFFSNMEYWKAKSLRHWRSAATAERLWTGSMAMPRWKRG